MTKLLQYQVEDIAKIHEMGDRALLASEMGLGKTITALKVLQDTRYFPAIVVTPAGLKRHWRKECEVHFGWTDKSVAVLYGEMVSGRKAIRRKKIVVINYNILRPWLPFLLSLHAQLIIIDEAHLIGNPNTQRSRWVRILCKRVPHIIGISGTPLTNNPFELFPILNILRSRQFNSPFAFGTQYCQAEKVRGQWKFKGAKNLLSLHKLLVYPNGPMIRRTKEEVLPQLPPKRRYVVPLDIEKRSEYEFAENNLLAWLYTFDLVRAQAAARCERFVRFGYLKQLAAKLKMKAVTEWIDNTLLTMKGKLLFGVNHKFFRIGLMEKYQSISVTIHGEMSDKQKGVAEQRFQEDPQIRILFGNIKACGLGLNLTAASDVAIGELLWTPGVHQQFEARPHRMTSVNPVDVYYLIAENTIEDKLCEIIQRKQKISDKVLDGVPVRISSLTILDELEKAMLLKAKKGRVK
jgi:SWI/SNF-related matrix-associated actin-dependent regulator of chromatin subfamily A-like protein 1